MSDSMTTDHDALTLESLRDYADKQHVEYLAKWRAEEDESEESFWDGLATTYQDIRDIIDAGRIPE